VLQRFEVVCLVDTTKTDFIRISGLGGKRNPVQTKPPDVFLRRGAFWIALRQASQPGGALDDGAKLAEFTGALGLAGSPTVDEGVRIAGGIDQIVEIGIRQRPEWQYPTTSAPVARMSSELSSDSGRGTSTRSRWQSRHGWPRPLRGRQQFTMRENGFSPGRANSCRRSKVPIHFSFRSVSTPDEAIEETGARRRRTRTPAKHSKTRGELRWL